MTRKTVRNIVLAMFLGFLYVTSPTSVAASAACAFEPEGCACTDLGGGAWMVYCQETWNCSQTYPDFCEQMYEFCGWCQTCEEDNTHSCYGYCPGTCS